MRYRPDQRIGMRCITFSDANDETILRKLSLPHLRVMELDANAIDTDPQFLRSIWDLFRGSDLFGYVPGPDGPNLNALVDCLKSVDEDGVPAKDYVLVIHNARKLWGLLPETAGTFINLWLQAADMHAGFDRGFDLIFVW